MFFINFLNLEKYSTSKTMTLELSKNRGYLADQILRKCAISDEPAKGAWSLPLSIFANKYSCRFKKIQQENRLALDGAG